MLIGKAVKTSKGSEAPLHSFVSADAREGSEEEEEEEEEEEKEEEEEILMDFFFGGMEGQVRSLSD